MPQKANFGNVVSVAPLEREQIGQAFPLVRTVAPNLTFEQWVQVAGSLTNPHHFDSRGILVATGTSGHFYGLCLYRVEPAQELKRIIVHYLVTFGIGRHTPVSRSLVNAIDGLASRLGCGGVQSSVATGQRDVLACLEAAGHRAHQVEFFKNFGEAGSSSGPSPHNNVSWLERWRPDAEALGPASEE